MKTAVLHKLEQLKIEEKPVPAVGADEVLIKVELCGICGTDFLVYDGRMPTELPYYNLGHEYIAMVEKVGQKVNAVSPGDRVVINPNYHCDCCYFCQRGELEFCENRRAFKTKSNGGFSEYVAIAQKLVCKVPAGLTAEKAIFAEPLSCCLHGLERIDIQAGDDVLIFGCGTMGLLVVQLCRLKGAGKIIVSEPLEIRRQAAGKLGADIVINPLEQDLDQIVGEAVPRGPRVVIESAGAKDTVSKALQIISRRGRLLLLAIWDKAVQVAINPALIVEKELTVAGTIFGALTLERAVDLLATDKIDVAALLTDVYKLDDLSLAIEKARGSEAIKVAVAMG